VRGGFVVRISPHHLYGGGAQSWTSSAHIPHWRGGAKMVVVATRMVVGVVRAKINNLLSAVPPGRYGPIVVDA